MDRDDPLYFLLIRHKVTKTHWRDAGYRAPGTEPFVCGRCEYIIWSEHGAEQDWPDRCAIVHGPYGEHGGISPEDTCALWQPKLAMFLAQKPLDTEEGENPEDEDEGEDEEPEDTSPARYAGEPSEQGPEQARDDNEAGE